MAPSGLRSWLQLRDMSLLGTQVNGKTHIWYYIISSSYLISGCVTKAPFISFLCYSWQFAGTFQSFLNCRLATCQLYLREILLSYRWIIHHKILERILMKQRPWNTLKFVLLSWETATPIAGIIFSLPTSLWWLLFHSSSLVFSTFSPSAQSRNPRWTMSEPQKGSAGTMELPGCFSWSLLFSFFATPQELFLTHGR